MISEGYKSAYQQGYSDAMRDFRKKQKYDVLSKVISEIIGLLSTVGWAVSEDESKLEGMKEAYTDCLKIIYKYESESEVSDANSD